MTERPILFSAPMVLALRENRKTQTRRTRGLDKINTEPDAWRLDGGEFDPEGWMFRHRDGSTVTICRPYGVGGDRLWTRETFYCDDYRFPNGPIEQMREALEYRVGHDCANWEAGCPCLSDEGRSHWRPSIHMPRWASRDTLEVVSARPERLQEITKADALTEGIQVLPLQSSDDPSAWYQSAPGVHQCRTAQDSFRQLWDSINGKKLPWSTNPWAWRVEYRRLPC